MLNAGIYHTLTVNRISDFGLYLINDDGDEVLLPNRYVSLHNNVGDKLDVFVYHDSEDRLVATTEKPYACVGQTAFLSVVDKTIHGAFLDWGLTAKDLFMPNRNMHGYVREGEKYVVYIYRDSKTGRAVATMEFRQYISNTDMNLKRGQQVDILVSQRTDTGYRVIVNDRHWGMIYDNQVFGTVNVGDQLKAYVRKISEDNKLDLSLQQEGFNEVKASADRLLELINLAGGELPVNDQSTPEDVVAATKMSKKVFKRSVGYLMKKGVIEQTDKTIKIKK